jgi:Family of unknown function (DUF6297)
MSAQPLPLAPRPVLARLRARRRAHRPPGQQSDRLIAAYGAVLYVVIGVVIAFRLLRQRPASGSAAAWLLGGGLARIGVATLLLGLLAAARHATWQGPVVFKLPEVQWLLTAPIDRAALVRLRLARALAAGAGLGAVLGLGAFVLLEAELGVPARPLLAAALLGPTAVGLLGAALGWLVERSPAASAAVLRASPLVLAAAAAAALVPGGAAGGRPLEWSGPWGWAVGPLIAAAGGRVPGWPVQAALLAAVAVAAALLAWSRAGAITTEELARRATARSGLAASLYSLDARGAAQARRRANRTLLGVRRVRLPRPRRRWLAIPWRDALGLLRAPARLGWAVVLAGAGVVAVAAEPDRRAVVAAAVLAGYLGAAQLVEPLRAEADQPDASRQLPLAWGDLLVLHCVVPTVALALVGWLASAAAWAAGLLHGPAGWLALLASPPLAAVLVLCAAVAGHRGRVSPSQLAMAFGLGEFGGPVYLFGWIALGPLLAEVLLAVTGTVLVDAGRRPGALTGALWTAGILLAAFLAGLLAYLRGRRAPA